MTGMVWRMFYTSAVITTALLMKEPAVMWALCVLMVMED